MRTRDYFAFATALPLAFALSGCFLIGSAPEPCPEDTTPVSMRGFVVSGTYSSQSIVVAPTGTPFVDGTPGARSLVVDRAARTAALTFQRNGETVTLHFAVAPPPGADRGPSPRM